MDVEDQIFPRFTGWTQEILSFPGYLRIDHKFEELFDQNTCTKIVKKFIELYPHFFNSKNNYFERHHRLGKNETNILQ